MLASISGAAKSINPYGFHSITLFILGLKSTLLTGLPASPFHSQKQQQKIPTPQTNKKKNTKNNLSFSNPIVFVGTFLPAFAETPKSAPELEKLSSLWFPDQIKLLFISLPW